MFSDIHFSPLPFSQWTGLVLTMLLLAALLALAPLKLSLLFLAGLALGLALLLHPVLGLYALALAIPFNASARLAVGPTSLGPTDILTAATFFAWFLQATAFRPRRRPAPLLLFLVPFVVVLLYSTLAASSLTAALPELVKWFEVIFIYWLSVQLLGSTHRLSLALTLLIAASIEALIGIRQFWFRLGPEAYLLGRFLRAYGTFGQPNPYAGYLGLTLPLAVSLSLWGVVSLPDFSSVKIGPFLLPKSWLPQITLRLFIMGATAVIGIGVLVSWSRGAWLGVAASTSAVLALSSIWGLVLLLVAGAGLIVAAPALPASIISRISDVFSYFGMWNARGVPVTDANFAILERVAHWQAAWEMWADHFWLGVGVGNWDEVYPRYAIGIWEASLGHAHNVLFHYAAVAGVLGAMGYLWLQLGILWQTFRAGMQRQGLEKAMAVGVSGMLVHLAVHNQFDNLWVQGMPLLIALCLALVSVYHSPKSKVQGPMSAESD